MDISRLSHAGTHAALGFSDNYNCELPEIMFDGRSLHFLIVTVESCFVKYWLTV